MKIKLNQKKRILLLTNYSDGICGVWNRVKEDAIMFAKEGHDVCVFSSNHIKGGGKTANHQAVFSTEGCSFKIIRFPAFKLGGESFMYWRFEEQARQFKPDVIIAHAYRHNHTHKAIKIANELKCKAILVTHAPFVEERGWLSGFIVSFYDNFIAQHVLPHFDKVVCVAKWEIPYLLKCGCPKEKIVHIPTSISDRFFIQKKGKHDIHGDYLYLGRISKEKGIDRIIHMASYRKDKTFNLVGPVINKDILAGIKEYKLSNVHVYPPITDLDEKIRLIDSHKCLILMSEHEAYPTVLLEAKARGKKIFSTDTKGAKEIMGKKNPFRKKDALKRWMRIINE